MLSLLGSDEIASDAPLMDAGIDSLAAAELAGRIGAEFCTEVPATVLFDYPSIAAIVEYLWHSQLRGDSDGSQLASPVLCGEATQGSTSLVSKVSLVANSLLLPPSLAARADLVGCAQLGLNVASSVPASRWDTHYA